MQIRKAPFVLSFALSALLVVGTTGFASGSDNGGSGNMVNGNSDGMMNMMNGMTNSNGKNIMQGHHKQMIEFMEVEDMQEVHEGHQEESRK